MSVIGQEKVGKTALIRRFCLNYYSDVYQNTISDYYKKEMFVCDQNYVLNITDVGNKVEELQTQSLALRNPDIVLLVFSSAEPKSLKYVEDRYKTM